MKLAKRLLRYTLIALFWLGLWSLAAWRVGLPLLLPSPREVLVALWGLMQTRAFYSTLALSLKNVTFGILSAIIAGVLLAAITSRANFVREAILPIMTVIKATPVASFIILALIWIGSARVPTFITVLIVLPVVWTNLDEGFRQLDPQLTELVRVYKMPAWRRVRLLVLPSLKPYFVSACRTSVGLAWKAGIAAEIIARPRGTIGTMLGDSKQYLETEQMFAWTLTVVLLSLAIEAIMALLFRFFGTKRRRKETRSC